MVPCDLGLGRGGATALDPFHLGYLRARGGSTAAARALFLSPKNSGTPKTSVDIIFVSPRSIIQYGIITV